MEPFTERMIARAKLRSKRIEKSEHPIPSTYEENNLKGKSHFLENKNDVSSKYGKINLGSFYSNESIPIRSPRKFKLSDAAINSDEKDMHSIIPRNLEVPQKWPNDVKLKSSFSKGVKHSLHLNQPSCLSKGQTFIPEAVSTPIPERANRSLEKSQGISFPAITDSNNESNNIYPRINMWEDIIHQYQTSEIAHSNKFPREMNNNFPTNFPRNLEHHQENQLEVPCGNTKIKDSGVLDEETDNRIEESKVCSILKNTDIQTDSEEGAQKNSLGDLNPRTRMSTAFPEVTENNKIFPEPCKVNLEDLDDMEDRVSPLEIKVNELKIDELNFPGIKQAHIMTEILPLTSTQEMPCSRNATEKNDADVSIYKRCSIREKYTTKLRCLKSKQNIEDEKKLLLMSSSKPNMEQNLSYDGVLDQNEQLEESNISNQRCSMVANTSDVDTGETDDVNYNTITELSHDDHSQYSFHSSDFSFSCSCSTSISQSSFHQEIPNESLPYLIIQNLSYNRKQSKSNPPEKKSVQVNNVGDNIDSAIHCESDNEEVSSRKDFSRRELKVNQLHRKVSIESTIMEQASKALSLCYSSMAFSASPQQIEGERLLLLSTVRKQAALDEIRRLEVQANVFTQKRDSIEIKIEKIRLHLMDEFLSTIATPRQHTDYYFLCLVSYQDTVLSSDVVQAKQDDPSIEFQSGSFKIEGQLCDNLSFCIRVYGLQVAQVVEENNRSRRFLRRNWETNSQKHSSVNCHSHCLSSCRASQSEGLLNYVNNGANTQHIIRIPSFVLTARTELQLPKDLNKTSFTLELYEPFCCHGNHFKIIQETANLQIGCTFKTTRLDVIIDKYISKEHQGFLTRFCIIGENGAWQREWWCLKGTFLLSWKYPEDEEYQPPLRVVDLKLSTDKISPVPRGKCARSNTFSIKLNEDTNIENRGMSFSNEQEKTSETEYLLSADTRQDKENWCRKLNGVLGLLQSWSAIPTFQN